MCEVRRRRTLPKCLQCPLLGVKVIKCLGKCQSTFLTFCGRETCSLPPDSPKGTSCQQLVFFCFFISQILHCTVLSYHILDKQMIYYNILVAFVFIFLLAGFSSSLWVAMTTNWNVMPAFHACHTSCERRFHSYTDSGFHEKRFSMLGSGIE